jgi:hypothetical protein
MRLHVALYEPIRIDLAFKNIAQTTFALAVLWPVAMIGGLRRPLDAGLLSRGAWAAPSSPGVSTPMRR